MSELPLRQALDAAGEVIFMTDRDGVFTFVNREFEHLYGYSSLEVVGHCTPRILKSGQTTPEAYATWWTRLHNGESIRANFVNRTRDGRLVEVEISTNVVRGDLQEIIGFLAVQRDVTVEKQAEAALKRSEERYRALAETAMDAIFIIDRQYRFEYVNSTAAHRFGRPAGSMVGRSLQEFFGPVQGSIREASIDRARNSKTPVYEEQQITLPEGVRWIGTWLQVIGGGDRPSGDVMGIARDTTTQHEMAEQLLQAQKMEAVGRLAGGIAHDFNNLLTPILGYSELLLRSLEAGDPRRADLEEVCRAAKSGGALTRQLLTFSRKQISEPVVLNLNSVMDELDTLLRRSIGEDSDVVQQHQPDLGSIRADRNQLEQVVMNLSVNARDAMPHGGTLTIATANRTLTESGTGWKGRIPPGDYVVLSVADVGTGITPEVLSHLFEPFFTTKAFGEGTGLGLSTVYGIVAESGGYIAVKTAIGEGTVFDIYLPRGGRVGGCGVTATGQGAANRS